MDTTTKTKEFLLGEIKIIEQARTHYEKSLLELSQAKTREHIEAAVSEWHASYLFFSRIVRAHAFNLQLDKDVTMFVSDAAQYVLSQKDKIIKMDG